MAVNHDSKANRDSLWGLNFGIDFLLAHIYTGALFVDENIPPFLLKAPIMCNAYSLFGEIANGKHYFGRDFMFPTAGVYQDTACLVIYNQTELPGKKWLPIVSQTAPGMVGSVAAMNSEGVAIGVDMSPTKLCNPARPGLNSLALNRDCMIHCDTIDKVVSHVEALPRGVSWLYPVSDGKSDKSCIIEAGANIGDAPFPYFDFLSDYYKENLKELNEDYITRMREKYRTPAPQAGMMVRWPDYKYPKDYITDFNKKMWKLYNDDFRKRMKKFGSDIITGLISSILNPLNPIKALEGLEKAIADLLKKIKYNPDVFGEKGYIDKTWKDHNCPGPFYFAPQREDHDNVVLVSNHCITPEMRLTAMNEWVAFVAAGSINDIQWRYDELNCEILDAIGFAKESKRPINKDRAWR
ncbi:MAG: hypothetical protein GTO45_25765, partial [Candidatus Aminicenantes bacterium]|nr:hypothetical protein [Candidatus Aminicenantes bacterium]NIM82146.1 hypothetical protein [Candidatus Aminicenantes bacterium]NIN21547.1 hypothetical protein [Candidatus Aminicenantes bacterium]NIN88177.1 hypothetical protein [Candidatus Aminicenantes bacterium]NIO84531.1 hypothetical protein [Candidatus Aminicenantes bacterium]